MKWGQACGSRKLQGVYHFASFLLQGHFLGVVPAVRWRPPAPLYYSPPGMPPPLSVGQSHLVALNSLLTYELLLEFPFSHNTFAFTLTQYRLALPVSIHKDRTYQPLFQCLLVVLFPWGVGPTKWWIWPEDEPSINNSVTPNFLHGFPSMPFPYQSLPSLLSRDSAIPKPVRLTQTCASRWSFCYHDKCHETYFPQTVTFKRNEAHRSITCHSLQWVNGICLTTWLLMTDFFCHHEHKYTLSFCTDPN